MTKIIKKHKKINKDKTYKFQVIKKNAVQLFIKKSI